MNIGLEMKIRKVVKTYLLMDKAVERSKNLLKLI
jgi:hypothetical protein